MAKYSERDKKAYKKYLKNGGTKPFGKWLVEKTTKMQYGADAKAVYKMSDKSKKNRGKLASSKKERP